jgi:hypothetical protein
MMTRSKVLRSPPTARNSSTAKSPAPVDESVPDIDSLFDAPEDINDASNSVTNNDVLQILQEIRGITRKIDALNIAVESIRQELKEDVITRIDQNETNIAAHDQRLDVIEEAIVELRDETEAASRATDLVVKGIPMQQNENAVDIYVKVASAIGYGNGGPNIPSADIFRLGRKKVGSKFDPPLLFRFPTIHDKTTFHRHYFQHLTLNLSDIGFSARQRIYIMENLTKKRQEVYTAAMKLRRDNKLHTVSTSNGRVMIKRDPRSRATPVTSMAELGPTTDGPQDDHDK